MFVICFISQWMKRSKNGLFVFPPTKTLVWRGHCSIGQSCYSMTSKRSIGWFLESSWAWSFFPRAFASPTKNHARFYPFDKPIKSLYFRSFVVSVLFARFHFKVIRKSLQGFAHLVSTRPSVWEVWSLIPGCDLKSFFRLLTLSCFNDP